MRNLAALLIAAVLPAALPAQAAKKVEQPAPTNAAYDAVVKGMTCRQQQNGRMDCEYRVGTALRFLIAGVGQQDAVVTFYNVNADAEGEYIAGVAPLHGCVIVRPAKARPDSMSNVAFVSPHDGKIYRNWNTCLRPAPKP